MAVLAYRGSSTCKQQVLECMRKQHSARRQLESATQMPDNRRGVNSVLQGETLDAWEQRTGLPKWLAVALDGLLANAPNVETAWARYVLLLQSIPVGADLSHAAGSCVLDLLGDSRHGLRALVRTDRMIVVLDRVLAFYHALLVGSQVTPKQWRQVRNEAMEWTDLQEENSLEAKIGACIEAVAWDPIKSGTVVSDALRTWIRAMDVAAARSSDWTEADHARIKMLLDQLHAEAKASAVDPDAFIDVFQLLELRYPEDAERLREDIASQHARAGALWQMAADALQRALTLEDTPALIPRKDLFANPARAGISISPDGQWLVWLASDNGITNLWASPRHQPERARQVTFDCHRGVHSFSWTYMPGLLLYSQDLDGDENWRLFGVDIGKAQVRELVPVPRGARVGIHSISRVRRSEVLITLNARDRRYPDLCLLDLDSGARSTIEENPGFAGYLADDHFHVRLAVRSTLDGGSEVLRRDQNGCWAAWITLSAEDARTSGPDHLSADGRTLYFRDSRGRETAALVTIDLERDTTTVLAEDAHADIGAIISDQRDYRPLAYAVTYERRQLRILDESIQGDVDFLDSQGMGEWTLGSRTEDDTVWLLSVASDVQPGRAYLYDRRAATLEKLFELRPQLAGAELSRMQSTVLQARDGLHLVSYLSVPVGSDAGDLRTCRPLPLVLLVHGGPWSRDSFGYNAMHQWLANRGYVVLAVNFRGSTGFGKAFITAADGEWGRKMDEDLEDAVQWAIECGIADPAKLAIFGASYGGYAVLSALTRFPHRYACGIDVVGPSNLETLLAAIPPYWEAARAMQYRAIGNPETEEGRALLRERSPLHRAAEIRAPLLIAQGANDPRVKQAESEQMVQALRSQGIAVEYALYPDEGHGFVREPNRMSFNALVEDFLARHLGGQVEPVPVQGFPGSTLQRS